MFKCLTECQPRKKNQQNHQTNYRNIVRFTYYVPKVFHFSLPRYSCYTKTFFLRKILRDSIKVQSELKFWITKKRSVSVKHIILTLGILAHFRHFKLDHFTAYRKFLRPYGFSRNALLRIC